MLTNNKEEGLIYRCSSNDKCAESVRSIPNSSPLTIKEVIRYLKEKVFLIREHKCLSRIRQ
jgi:hypothetical protein